MKRLIRYIQEHLSLRLGLLITAVIALVFLLIFGLLFMRSRMYVQRAAIDHAMQLLDNKAERITCIMNETENVTNFMALTTPRHLSPDSLLVFSRRAIIENSFLTGMALSMEPNFFPEMGRYFSAYSLRMGDSIITVREGPFEYFEAVWYKTPRMLGKACWVDCYDDYNEGTLSSPDILTSYCCPMRDSEGRYLGSITASLTLKWLSEFFTDIKPYPNSSAIVIGRNGTYLAHPDTTKLYKENIFSDADPESKSEVEDLGKAMLAGRSGIAELTIDGNDSFVFYRPLKSTGWSLAIVCPKSDVFAKYYQQVFNVLIVIGLGLLLLLFLCYQTVRHAMTPLQQLDILTQNMTKGHFDNTLQKIDRHDSVGRLHNSFISMQQALTENVNNIRRVNAELEQSNQELTHAYQLRLDANRQKAAFIRDMYHEIRTPLNIISGFAQVLVTSFHDLPPEEVNDISTRMEESAADLSHLIEQLDKASGLYNDDPKQNIHDEDN